MRIFLAGATGVLGCALIPHLILKGYIVRGLVRTAEQARSLELAGVEALQGDLLSPETLEKLPEMMHGCTTVIHAATAIPADFQQPGAWQVNTRIRTEGTDALLRAALASGVERYIQQSIVMAYPDGGEQWLDETTPLDTSSSRAEICAPVIAMEAMLKDIAPERLQWTILRGGRFVGPETMQEQQLALLRKGELTVTGNGHNYISPINVTDMALAVVAALENFSAGSIFNIVDEPLREGDYLDHLADLLNVPHPPRSPQQSDPPSHRCTSQAAQNILHWQPVCSIWPSNLEQA